VLFVFGQLLDSRYKTNIKNYTTGALASLATPVGKLILVREFIKIDDVVLNQELKVIINPHAKINSISAV